MSESGTPEAILSEIQARVDAATPGPWHEDWDMASNDCYGVWSPLSRVALTHREKRGWDDAVFIAHAREDVPALLDLVERLTAERDDYTLDAFAHQAECLRAAEARVAELTEALRAVIASQHSAFGVTRQRQLTHALAAARALLGVTEPEQ